MGPIAAPEGVRCAPGEVVRVVYGVTLEPLSGAPAQNVATAAKTCN